MGALAYGQSNSESYSVLLQMAKQGDSYVQALVAYHLKEGHGVDKDLKKAQRWAKRAAKGRVGLAYWLLAQMDDLKRKEYLDSALACDYPLAASYFARVYLTGSSYHGIERNKDVALNLFEKSIYSGRDIEAAAFLGVEYLREGRDLNKAFEFLDKAAQQGDAESMNLIAYMLYHGIGSEKNDSSAFAWFQKAAKSGAHSGMEALADCYRIGVSVPASQEEAFRYYSKIEDPSPRVQYLLGSYYANDKDNVGDLQKSKSLLYASERLGYLYSQALIGICLYEGTPPFDKNLKEAILYLKQTYDNPDFKLIHPSVRQKVYKYLSGYYRFGREVEADVSLSEKLLAEAEELQSEVDADACPFAYVGMKSIEEAITSIDPEKKLTPSYEVFKQVILDYPEGLMETQRPTETETSASEQTTIAENGFATPSTETEVSFSEEDIITERKKSDSYFAVRIEGASTIPSSSMYLGLGRISSTQVANAWLDRSVYNNSAMLGLVDNFGSFFGLGFSYGQMFDASVSDGFPIYQGFFDVTIPFLSRRRVSPYIEGFVGGAYIDSNLGGGVEGGGALGLKIRMAKHTHIQVGVKATYISLSLNERKIVTVLPTIGIEL